MGREFVECLTTCNNTITRISANFRNMEKPIKIIGWMNSVHVWDDQNDIKMLTCSTFFLSKNRHATVCVITTYGDRPKIEMCTLTSGWRALKLHQHVCIHFVFPWGDTFTHKHAYLVSTCFNYDWWLVLLKPQWNNLKQFLRVGAGERCVFRYLLLARSFCKKNNHSCVFDNKSCPRAAPQFFTDIAAPRIFISKGPRFTILRYYCIIL
jgi:hypothetical protein